MELWRDANYLREEFVNKRRTAKEIAFQLNVNDSSIEYYLGKYKLYNIRGRLKNTYNPSKFNPSDPVFNYYAGLVATDGYIDLINNRVSIRIKNEGAEQLLNALKKYFEYSGDVRVYKGNYDLTITSKELITELEYLNVIGYKKTYKLQFPRKFLGEECQKMFLRGVLDGDGNIKSSSSSHKGGQFRIVTASKDFIQGLINSINEQFNLNYVITIAKIKGVEYPKLEMRRYDSLKFYDWIYKGFDEFKLTDKHNKYLHERQW
jgi:hypothetical protein